MQGTGTKIGFIAVLAAAAIAGMAQANNIRIENVDITPVDPRFGDVLEKTAYVEFDVSWENSWNNALNHDAAWVFVKFRAPGSNDWQHAYLSTHAGHHAVPDGSGKIEVGISSNAVTDPLGVGVFLYSAAPQTGSVSYASTRLLWDYGLSGYDWRNGDEIEIAVQAIEMVYVAEGAFYVGTGGDEPGSFTDGKWTNGEPPIPLLINSEDELLIEPTEGNLWGISQSDTSTIGGADTLPAAFPKGFAAFYCQKYEVTQGQYADFLNLLTASQADAHYPGPGKYNDDRYTIQAIEGQYSADAPDRACNWMLWPGMAAYAAWSGLRPMTELEFEKACRGPESPVPNEYAWGTTSLTKQTGEDGEVGSGTETATPSDANCNYRAGISGPVRAGIYATNGATRVRSGASYWGIMELTGNMYERPVSVASGRSFTGLHGLGVLNGNNAAVTGWPGTDAVGTGRRGGSWYRYSDPEPTSDRSLATSSWMGESALRGWRAVRSAP